MENTTGIPKSALDFKGYGELKALAGAKDAKATKEVAQQFEAMFIQMMLKSMRKAVPKNELMQSKTMETFEAMHDREVAVALARKGGLGLAKMVEEHLNTIQGSSKEYLESKFELNKSLQLEQKERAFRVIRDLPGKSFSIERKTEKNIEVEDYKSKSFPLQNSGN